MAAAYRILLFDIDGTLISSGGTVAWQQLFDELHGIPADFADWDTPRGVDAAHAAARRDAGADHVLGTLEEPLPLT